MNYIDHREAAVDAIALALGANVQNEHPMARNLDDILLGFAVAAGNQMRPQQNHERSIEVAGRGMATSDFSKVLADGAQILVGQVFAGAANHRAFCAKEQVNDFRPAGIAAIDLETNLELVSELHEITFGAPVEGAGNIAQLRTFAKILGFSRQTIVNDNLGAIARAMRGLANSAAACEGALVTAALEENPVLDDGEPVFHQQLGNLIPSTFPSAFAAGITALRKQKLPGGMLANLEARHLVVAADIEFEARSFVYINFPNLVVSVLPGLPDGRWYVLADQAIAPTIAVLELRGSKRPVMIEQQTRDKISFDGTCVKARADLGAVMLGRHGIVRGGL